MSPVINVKALKCNKCGYVWLSHQFLKDGIKPIACARCKSAYYDREPTSSSSGNNKMKNKK